MEKIPTRQVAVVFGAGLRSDGSPTPVLVDRVKTAASLYETGKIEKVVMSGFDNQSGYSEPESMRKAALALGVPDQKIMLDNSGKRTFATCRRVEEITGNKNVILVSQTYHLPRAIFTCNHFGIDAIGVSANWQSYKLLSRLFWQTRELAATAGMFWDIFKDRVTNLLYRLKG